MALLWGRFAGGNDANVLLLHKGFSGYQALLKAYISEGLRRDEAVHLFGPAARLAEALQKRGVSAQLIEEAAKEAAT